MLFRDVTKQNVLLRQPIASVIRFCYDIGGKSYDKYDPFYALPRR